MDPSSLEILYEDNHLLAVVKPAGLATMGTPAGRPTLLSVAKDYVKRRYDKPGNVYLGVMSRLDAPVTGVVLLARTSKAARRLTEQFRSRSVEKVYWAVVEGQVKPSSGQWVNWVAPDERHRRMHVVGPTISGAKEARLAYRRLGSVGRIANPSHGAGGNSLLEIELETGRKHQIRLQAADRGHPILGDRKYGSLSGWPAGIALCARRLVVAHPISGELLVLEAPLPQEWKTAGWKG